MIRQRSGLPLHSGEVDDPIARITALVIGRRQESARLVRPEGGVDAPAAEQLSCEPCSTMRPRSRMTSRSMRRTVESRCAMTIAVRFSISVQSASWMSISLSESSELVASSSTRIGASFRIARAIAMRWRWPPESFTPRSPTSVVVAVGQRLDELRRVRQSAARADLVVARVGTADADVLGDGAMEHRRVLRHVGDGLPQRGLRHAIDRCPPTRISPAVDIGEAQQQSRERRLAAARSSDETDLLAGAIVSEAVEQRRLDAE